MIKEDKLSKSKERLFYTPPPFFDYVWAARKGLNPATAKAFADAMLALDSGNAEQKTILDLLRASKYGKAEDSSYGPGREAAKHAGLLKGIIRSGTCVRCVSAADCTRAESHVRFWVVLKPGAERC